MSKEAPMLCKATRVWSRRMTTNRKTTSVKRIVWWACCTVNNVVVCDAAMRAAWWSVMWEEARWGSGRSANRSLASALVVAHGGGYGLQSVARTCGRAEERSGNAACFAHAPEVSSFEWQRQLASHLRLCPSIRRPASFLAVALQSLLVACGYS